MDLGAADFRRANPRGADLREAKLEVADLTQADLFGADFNRTLLGGTLFIDIDLRCAIGLESASHRGPSHIGIDTLVRSNGEIPENFLEAASVPELSFPNQSNGPPGCNPSAGSR